MSIEKLLELNKTDPCPFMSEETEKACEDVVRIVKEIYLLSNSVTSNATNSELVD